MSASFFIPHYVHEYNTATKLKPILDAIFRHTRKKAIATQTPQPKEDQIKAVRVFFSHQKEYEKKRGNTFREKKHDLLELPCVINV